MKTYTTADVAKLIGIDLLNLRLTTIATGLFLSAAASAPEACAEISFLLDKEPKTR